MPNDTFQYNDRHDEIIYCIFCDENYKYQNTFEHCHSESHRNNRLAMLRNIPRHSEFCNGDSVSESTNDSECPHLIEEDNDWWCGIGFESIYGKRGELSTGKEFGEDARKPRRPQACTIAKPREIKMKGKPTTIDRSGWSQIGAFTLENPKP